jgi:hypothetical protein
MGLFFSRWAMNAASWTLIAGIATPVALYLEGFVEWRWPDPNWLGILRISIACGITVGFWSTWKEGA